MWFAWLWRGWRRHVFRRISDMMKLDWLLAITGWSTNSSLGEKPPVRWMRGLLFLQWLYPLTTKSIASITSMLQIFNITSSCDAFSWSTRRTTKSIRLLMPALLIGHLRDTVTADWIREKRNVISISIKWRIWDLEKSMSTIQYLPSWSRWLLLMRTLSIISRGSYEQNWNGLTIAHSSSTLLRTKFRWFQHASSTQ